MTATVEAAPSQAVQRPLAARCLGWALLVGCLVLVACCVVVGEREASYDELRAAVRSGDVDEVIVSGGLSDAYRGRVQVAVHWRTATGWRVAAVVEQHPLQVHGPRAVPVVHDVGEDLAALDADIHVDRRRDWRERPTGPVVLGWRLPTWTRFLMGAVYLSCLVLAVAGLQPWRANRWAWFWLLLLAAPVGVPAFLLLGGGTGAFPPRTSGRLRGGWGFLLAFVLGGLLDPVLR